MPIIVWIGRFMLMNGYAWATKNYFIAMQKAGLRVVPVDSGSCQIIGPAQNALVDVHKVGKHLEITARDPSDSIVAVVHERPDDYDILQSRGRCRLIGYSVVETERIPHYYHEPMLEMDEIWTASEFNRKAFMQSHVPEYMVQLIPHCIDANLYGGAHNRIRFPGAKSFKFLNVVSNFNRKDIGTLLRGYFRAFTSEDDVSLILKFPEKYDEKTYREQVIDSIRPDFDIEDPQLPHIHYLRETLSDERMVRLYGSCDAYISTERGKGWDLPSMEAMASGRPVISIAWSANLEFMNEENSFLVRTTGNMVPVDPTLVEAKEMYAGHRWAEIDEEDLLEKIRTVYHNRTMREDLAVRGRQSIEEGFSHERIADRITALVGLYESHHFRENTAPKVIIRPKAAPGKIVPKKQICFRLIEDHYPESELDSAGLKSGRQVRNWIARHYRQNRPGHPFRPGEYELRRLAELKDRYRGERIFLLGNGTSLNDLPISHLRNEYVFGIDRVHLLYRKIDFRPSFYLASDWDMMSDIALDLRAQVDLNPSQTLFFFPEYFRGLVSNDECVCWFHLKPAGTTLFQRFEMNATRGLCDHGSSLIHALQIATFMGFSEIYLVGVDLLCHLRSGDRQIQIPGDPIPDAIHFTSSDNRDPNHFDPRYHGENSHWTQPDFNRIRTSLRSARKLLELNNQRLFHTTPSRCKLDLESVNFESLFAPLSSRKKNKAIMV